jgi:hypothetical protein
MIRRSVLIACSVLLAVLGCRVPPTVAGQGRLEPVQSPSLQISVPAANPAS